jgi:RNA polymerase sigma-70 factor (ECF subfamily)
MTPKEITQFYERYKIRLYNIALRIVGDSMDAEEVVHDVIIKFLRSEQQEVAKPQIEAWLCKSCVRASIDVVRKRDVRKRVYDSVEIDSDVDYQECEKGWSELIAKNEKKRLISLINKYMNQLSDGYRMALSLILFEGYDYQEVAEIMDVEESTVRSQYLRGKKRLLQLIQGNLSQIK